MVDFTKKKQYPLTLDVIENMDKEIQTQIQLKNKIFDTIFELFPTDKITSFEPFAQTLYIISKQCGGLSKNGGIFYDLGCGTAKPAFAASLLYQFDKIVGVEYIKDIYDELLKVEQEYNKKKLTIQKEIQKLNGGLPYKIPEMQFIHGDLFKIDWSDGDVVFVNSTCMDEEMMVILAEKSNSMKKGSFFICTTYEFPANKDQWKNEASYQRMFSWGSVTIHIYQKVK